MPIPDNAAATLAAFDAGTSSDRAADRKSEEFSELRIVAVHQPLR